MAGLGFGMLVFGEVGVMEKTITEAPTTSTVLTLGRDENGREEEAPTENNIINVNISDIKIINKRRKLNDLNELKNSIHSIGLINPITITENYHLIAGYHRLEACKELGWKTMPVKANELTAELIEIDENLIRNELTVLERGETLKRRKEIYEAMYPESKKGQYGKKGTDIKRKAENEIISFSEDTANKTGFSSRTVQQEVQIADKIDEEVKEIIRETELADNKTELLKIARQNKEKQKELVEKIVTGTAKNINDARKQIAFEEKKEVSINELKNNKYSVIYADPPWKYDNSGYNTGVPDLHYPTMTNEEIINLPIKNITTENAILFLWATNPLLKEALKVIEAWGFEYKTNMVWIKDKFTYYGFYCYGKHELLLIATKGSMLPKREGMIESIIEADRGEHSKKPEIVYSIIENMFPGFSYLELFSRNKREKWYQWGNES
jgi:N6-adenosine-specific RNA methylase IME4/ParB-like chromosome segregation protein Spo0J